MSLLITEGSQQTQKLTEEQFNINVVMRNISITVLHRPTSGNYLQYEMPLTLGHFRAKVHWIFTKKQNSYFIDFKPMLVNHVTSYVRVESQRQLVDVLRVMNGYNKAKDSRFKCMVDKNNYVSLYYAFDAKLTKPPLYNIHQQLSTTAKDLNITTLSILNSIKPYLSEQMPLKKTDRIIPTSSFAQKSTSFLLFTAYAQGIRNVIHQNQFNDPSQMSAKVLTQMDAIKQKANQNIGQAFRVMGSEDIKISKTAKLINKTKDDYDKWLQKTRKKTKSDSKNVYGIVIKARLLSQSQLNDNGAHSKILFGKFRVMVNLSINNEVNQFLQEGSLEREMELAKKVCRSPNTQMSKNSFQNELCLITYIKDRSCEFVATYYWQLMKKRENMDSIFMECYPRTLAQTIGEQRDFLSMKSKLILMQQLASAVSWLADNYICHRDIKPQNIMMSVDDTPKLVDFGSCCPVYKTTAFTVKETRLLGTKGFFFPYSQCPPELKKRMGPFPYQQHHLFDAYSLGAVMEQIFTEKALSIIPNLGGLLRYMSSKCKEVDPNERMTYEELMFLLQKSIEYVQRSYNQPH